MADKIRVNTATYDSLVSQLNRLSRELSSCSGSVGSVRIAQYASIAISALSGRLFKTIAISGSAGEVGSALRQLQRSLNELSRHASTLAKSVEFAKEVFLRNERQLVDLAEGKVTVEEIEPQKKRSILDDLVLYINGFTDDSLIKIGITNEQTGKSFSILEINNPTGSVSGPSAFANKFDYEDGTYGIGGKAGVNIAKGEGSWTFVNLFEGLFKQTISDNFSIGDAEIHGEGYIGNSGDGINVGTSAKGASNSVIAETSLFWGAIKFTEEIEIGLGTADAHAESAVGFRNDKFNLYADIGAEANAAEGKLNSSVSIFGIKFKVGGAVSAGVGGSAGLGIKDNAAFLQFGLKEGPGASIRLEIDPNDLIDGTWYERG